MNDNPRKLTADVVIIGGGIVGASVAYHLAERGCTDVLILERELKQGLGSTGKATGGVRAQFATPINIAMSCYSINFLARFRDATGFDSGYEPAGYLFVATTDAQLEYLQRTRDVQLAAGLTDVELLTPDEIARRVPQLRISDVTGGSFRQADGFVAPLQIMRGFTARAIERGVRLLTGVEVTGIEIRGGRVRGVRTSRGEVSTRVIVNAAGAWAARVAEFAGVVLPVTPLRRQLVDTKPFAGLPARLPMVIEMSSGFHFRPLRVEADAPHALRLAWPDPTETPGFKTDFDPSFVERVLAHAEERVPALARVEVNPDGCRAGLYEVTPDHHAILGESKEVGGLYYANGFSGHGVMHSPATGRILAEIVLDGHASLLDAAPLGADRFAAGRLLEETSVL